MRRKRINPFNILAIIFLFLFCSTLTFLLMKDGKEISAASTTGFVAGNIISDYTMSNYSTMTEAEIQTFLKSKNLCNKSLPNSGYTNEGNGFYSNTFGTAKKYMYHVKNGKFVCLADEIFGSGNEFGETVKNGETAAHIIWQTAQEFKINPQVLIVLLEKEQGLISDQWPNNYQYRAATGYGCPDTAACDAKYYGFKNQVRKAAELFRTVLDGGWTNYPLGNNYIQYNPDRSCGGSTVNVENLATSALYRYTPYQPNAATLAAGYGTATCGAYGNRNFYLYFSDWFGDPKRSNTDTRQEDKDNDIEKKENLLDEKQEPLGENISSNNQEQIIPEAEYIISSALKKDMVIDITNGITTAKNYTNIQLYEANSTAAQIWKINYNKQDNTYTFINPATKKALDLDGAKTSNGTNIQLYDANGTCAQKWHIVEENGHYVITSACNTKKAIDVSSAKTTNGTNIQLYDINGTNAQYWNIEKKA